MNASTDNSGNAKAFTDAIKRMAAEECKKIDDETAEIEKQRLEIMENDAKQRHDDFVSYETARISADTNRRISALEEQARARLVAKRNELYENVFGEVASRLADWRKTDDYRCFLLKCVTEISNSFDDAELEFFVMPGDMKYRDDIEKALGSKAVVSEDKEILFGGIRAVDRRTDCLADNTLDLKLKQQKQLFLSTSGLKI